MLVLTALNMAGFAVFTFPKKDARPAKGKGQPYACGHDMNHRVRPDYSQFFHFAFFFTIMHVVVLMVATVPGGSTKAAVMAAFFLVASAIGLFISFRRW
jgi:NADH-quinone oxidoreductase subunit A